MKVMFLLLHWRQGELDMITLRNHASRSYMKWIPVTADRLAQLVEHRTAVREVAGSNLGRTNTQGL